MQSGMPRRTPLVSTIFCSSLKREPRHAAGSSSTSLLVGGLPGSLLVRFLIGLLALLSRLLSGLLTLLVFLVLLALLALLVLI
jgi:hypothetical protein